LNPTYTIRDETGFVVEIGEVEGSKPYVLPPPKKDPRLVASLRTEDIIGAKASTKGLGVFAENHERKHTREINKIEDIEGAMAGSLKKGTTTKRITNPLDPVYEIPGAKELDQASPYGATKNEILSKS
jgi:hypothetical protein